MAMLKEIWRDVKGYGGIYQVSNFGNIRSLDRRVVNHKGGTTRILHGIVMKPWDNGNGYLVATLNCEGKRRNCYIHRLVAETFLENHENKTFVNHKDYDTHNNRADNLEWCTQKENISHSICHMSKPKIKSRPTNTGEKYISQTMDHGKHMRYRVIVRAKKADKSFKTLKEAILYRNEVVGIWQNQ